MGKLKEIMATCVTAAALCVMPLSGFAQTLLEAGKTDCGVLYVDTDSISTVKKDGKYYLAVFAEEKYTDVNFLSALRSGEDMQNAVSAIYLYLFNTYGNEYCIGANYIVDSEGKVCADLGSDMLPKEVSDNKTLKNVYAIALKILERKKSVY
mgnify:FL=1